MKFEETNIKGCYIIEPTPLEDERGWFSRVFCEKEASPYFGDFKIVQINHSFNTKQGTFRGMHYQTAPYAEAKLIRCISGSIMDFVLDIRKDSPTFLKWISVKLSAKNRNLIFLPKGMAHGFQTLENNSEMIYHHSEFFNIEADRGICYNDPLVNIITPLTITMISDKDKNYVTLDSNFKGI